MRAASRMVSGIDSMYCRIMNMPKMLAIPGMMTPQYVLMHRMAFSIRNSGASAARTSIVCMSTPRVMRLIGGLSDSSMRASADGPRNAGAQVRPARLEAARKQRHDQDNREQHESDRRRISHVPPAEAFL